MDYEDYFRAISYDSLSEEINGLKIEISDLVNREFDLECEVERLREAIADIAKSMDEDWRHWRNELKKVIE
jgi:regulator of replication initiation timing